MCLCRHQKIAKNGKKYRAEQCYGSSAKYTAYAAAAAPADGWVAASGASALLMKS